MSQNLISPSELKVLMASQDAFVLVDVREDSERELAVIDFGCHIPMGEITTRYEELDKEKETVIYCHSGVRSFQVCRLLEMLGFARVRSLVGGIDAWSQEIDSEIKRY